MGSRLKESPESVFEVYMEVVHPSSRSSGPAVQKQFPDDYSDQETLQTLPKFCFPFSMDSLTVNNVGQNFTFVLTDIKSKQRFGFCRLSSGAHTCYCILSYLPWFEVFYKLLNILADYTVKGQETQRQELLVSLHTLPIPEPGVPVHLGVHSFFTVPDIRELPSIPENRNLTEYFVAVDVNNMLHLYASMLYERRILICCSKLSTTFDLVFKSHCLELGFSVTNVVWSDFRPMKFSISVANETEAMLYPMHWQHVYIPVLPQHLLDYCCAPMPYLIGVHSSLMEKVRGMALDDVVVLNVDTNTLETPYDDLQTLPNEVVTSLKNRLKKVSTTTGDGVAQAFLKSQVAIFGSYRNALQFESGEPITFNEDAFVNHGSSAMRQFLQNAIHLQLFKQFIDGRLDLLNSGEGFSDVFEEEINMGEYAGSTKTYHQWLFTVKRGGGAIFNTVKTKANPAMKTVYKIAKDHAKMRIKEVKSRLKQKEQVENGYAPSGSEVIADDSPAGLAFFNEVRRQGALPAWEDHRPITVHFEHARPLMLLKRPNSNVTLDTKNDPPQPYHSLKEVDLMEGDDASAGETHTAPPRLFNEKLSKCNLLGEAFGCQEEPDSQPCSLTKSLEDLRNPKDPGVVQTKFNSKRLDLSVGDHSRTFPGLKLTNPYNKLWTDGYDDAVFPVSAAPVWDPRPSVRLPEQTFSFTTRPESSVLGPDLSEPSTLGNITIPRPQGRKTPEPGTVLVTPAAQTSSKAAVAGEGQTTVGGQEFRQALSMSTDREPLKPLNVCEDDQDLISLLDPLKASAQTSSSVKSVKTEGGTDTSPSFSTLGSYPLGLSPFPVHSHVSLNPFVQPLQNVLPQTHFPLNVSGNPFSAACRPPPAAYLHTLPKPQTAATKAGIYAQHSPGSSALPLNFGLLQSGFPSTDGSLPPPSANSPFLSSLASTPTVSSSAVKTLPKPLSSQQESLKPQDPFDDLLTLAKPAPTQKRSWETFD